MNYAFDPASAAKDYAAMETEELVRIAYLEPDYVPEAKASAVRELDRRGVPYDRKSLIREVRAEIEDRAIAAQRQSSRNMEQAQRVQARFAFGVLILGLWCFALIVPIKQTNWRQSPDAVGWLLLLAWAVAVVDAVRKARRGMRRQLYFVLVIPVALFLLGTAMRLLR